MKSRNLDIAYLRCAFVMSELSKAVRKKVGSILVSYDGAIPVILADGVNGTIPGEENLCEDLETGKTLDSVIHAEENCLRKVDDALKFSRGTLYVTFQPCPSCCQKIIQFNTNPNQRIERVVYCYGYKDETGLDWLRESGVTLTQIPVSILDWELSITSEKRYNMSGVLRALGHTEGEIGEMVKVELNQ